MEERGDGADRFPRYVVLSGLRAFPMLNGRFKIHAQQPMKHGRPVYCHHTHPNKLLCYAADVKCWVLVSAGAGEMGWAYSPATNATAPHRVEGVWSEFDGASLAPVPSLKVVAFALPVDLKGCKRHKEKNGTYRFTGQMHDGLPVYECGGNRLFFERCSWRVATEVGGDADVVGQGLASTPDLVREWQEFAGTTFACSPTIECVRHARGVVGRGISSVRSAAARGYTKRKMAKGTRRILASTRHLPEVAEDIGGGDEDAGAEETGGEGEGKGEWRGKGEGVLDPATLSFESAVEQAVHHGTVAKISKRRKERLTRHLVVLRTGHLLSYRNGESAVPSTVVALVDASVSLERTDKGHMSFRLTTPLVDREVITEEAAAWVKALEGAGVTVVRSEKSLVSKKQRSASPKLAVWKDHEFPAASRAVFLNKASKAKGLVVASWLRPHQISAQPALYVDGIEAGDVRQGCLGDCWFLSALSVVSTRQDLVTRLFVATEGKPPGEFDEVDELSPNGRYTVRLFKNGRWHFVDIDDRIPCNANGLPAFAHGANLDEMWVVLLEKAYAKMHGCYEALEGGSVDQGLMDLTGELCKVTRFPSPEEKEKAWEDMLESFRNGFLMGTAVLGNGRDEELANGLIVNHAYGVLDMVHMEGVSLVQLRNPWGKGEWGGKWSDKSEVWDRHLSIKEKLHLDKDDGVFWMEKEDFLAHFNVLYTCFVHAANEWRKTQYVGYFKPDTAFGPPSPSFARHPNWFLGPQYRLSQRSGGTARVLVHLQQVDSRVLGKDEYAHSLGVLVVREAGSTVSGGRLVGFSAEQVVVEHHPRLAQTVSAELDLCDENYFVLPFTEAGAKVGFIVSTSAHKDSAVALSEVPPLSHPCQLRGVWGNDAAVGGLDGVQWSSFPRFSVKAVEKGTVWCFVQCLSSESVLTPRHAECMLSIGRNGEVAAQTQWGMEALSLAVEGSDEELTIVPCKRDAEQQGSFRIVAHGSCALDAPHAKPLTQPPKPKKGKGKAKAKAKGHTQGQGAPNAASPQSPMPRDRSLRWLGKEGRLTTRFRAGRSSSK